MHTSMLQSAFSQALIEVRTGEHGTAEHGRMPWKYAGLSCV